MDRTEKVGLGVALAGHVALFGLLSLGLLAAPDPKKLEEHPVEVSLVADVGPEQTAPPAPTPPSQSVAPDAGAPEDAAPPPPAPEPVPVPKPAPAPEPKPAAKPEPSPEPKPKPVPPKPVPPKPVVKPVPKPVPATTPAPPKPKPKPAEPVAEAPAKPAKAKPVADAAPAKPAKAAPTGGKPAPAKAATTPAKPAPTTGTGSGEGKATRPKGSRLGSDFLKGLTDTPSKAPPSAAAPAPAAKIGAQALAGIGAAIKRQIQPCADRQVNPGPGAEHIRVVINLKLNRDGSLAAPPRVVNHDGVDDDNRRYLDRVDDLGIAAFTGCSPLTGLPADLYDVPGGWRSITLTYKLPG